MSLFEDIRQMCADPRGDKFVRALEVLLGRFRISLPRTVLSYMRRKPILVGRGFHVRGAKGITFADSSSLLALGIRPYGFADPRSRGAFRNRGSALIAGKVAIGVGSRIDIGPEATLTIGRGTYLSPNVRVVISKGLFLGSDCAIGWDVQFLDDNFHGFGSLNESLSRKPKAIILGDHVWVGSHALIYRGVEIARGCVVAGGSVVTHSFLEPNSLIAGNPARIIRRDVDWD